MRIDRFRFWPALAVLGIQAGLLASAQEADRDFKPELAAVEFTSRQVRPGDPFAMTIKFRNAGTKPARSDYWVFVHFGPLRRLPGRDLQPPDGLETRCGHSAVPLPETRLQHRPEARKRWTRSKFGRRKAAGRRFL